ncbi:hypothetical protein [Azotobacter salinestris]|uniref:hypothetical protein n=1 Tax=Azotobacter salinestris TaxID=69964 RepID=UPI001FCC22B8|nr:hypothetical protein [Azotobacter salinestris]
MTRLLSFLLIACQPWQAGAESADEALLVQGGYVMTLDPTLGDMDGGKLLIRDGRILAVWTPATPGASTPAGRSCCRASSTRIRTCT